MSASTPRQATRAPKLSVTDLPIGIGAGLIPLADQVHPKNWFKSGEIAGTGAPIVTPHSLGRVPPVFMCVPTIMGEPGIGGGCALTAQSADGTNVTVTATNLILSYRIFAI